MPAFFLTNFTPEGTREAFLWVTDMKSHRQWRATPKNTGHQRDFYRVEGEGIAPETAEEMLGSIEDKAAPVIRQVIESRTLPGAGDHLDALLYFVALLATRIPATRERIDDVFDQIAQLTLEVSSATSDRWESILRGMRERGYTGQQPSFEEVRRIVAERGMRFRMSKNWQVAQMFRSANTVFPTLMRRTWCLLLSESGSLICSDHPVTLVFTEPAPPFMSPGFGLNHTEVTVPLSRHVLLRGVWGQQPDRAVSLNRNVVSHYNTIRMLQADRFLFSTAQDFPWFNYSSGAFRDGLAGLPEFLQSQDIAQ